MTLSFFVEKQKITRTDTETPAANSNCYLKAKFEFGDDWDTSSSICPIFRRGGEDSGYMPKLTNGSFLDVQNICFVPIEVLNKEGRFFVSILDYKSGKTITTNEAMVEVSRSGPVFNSPTIYSLDLRFENENLQLTANGEAVGDGVEIPKQEIDDAMSDTSENPVQNKVAKAYTDEKTKATPTDIYLTNNHLQLTANGETVGNGVELPTPPDGLQLDGNTLHLTENGVLVGTGAELPTVTVDSSLSYTSENPVQNKAVAAALSKLKNRILFDTKLTQNTRSVFIDKDLSGAYLNLSEYSVFFFGKIKPNTPFYINSFYTLAGKQYLTCYSGSHTTDGSKNILFHLHVKKSGILIKGVFPDSIIETADTDLITGGSFSTKNEKSTCCYASAFSDGGIKNITFGVRTTGVDMLEGSRIIITGVDL